MKNFIPTSVTRKVATAVLKTKKNSPVILFGAGVIGMVGTVVTASVATLKIEEVLAETNQKIEVVKSAHESGRSDYSEQDYKRDSVIVRTQGALALAKLYAPTVILGCLSIGALTGSHVVLTKRNTALLGAYATLEKGFNEYRQRIEEEFGTEKERELRFGKEVVETKDEKGKVVKETFVAETGSSIYARFFDQLCSPWSKTPEYNLMFLRAQQTYFNDRLQTQGHVFLNEIYDALDIPRSQAGQIVGWVVSEDEGDNYIDFGLFDSNRESARDFINGREGAILLDFNVDGPVYNKI